MPITRIYALSKIAYQLYLIFYQLQKEVAMKCRSLLPYLIIALLVTPTLQATSTQTVSPNQKYFATGVVAIDTTSSYNNASATWNPNVYQVPYPVTFGSGSVAGVFLSINSLQVTYQNNRISFYGTYSDIGATSFSLNLYSNITAAIQTLSYRYLIYSQSIITRTYFDSSVVIQPVQKNITKNTSYEFPVYPYSGFNITGGIDGTVSLIGYDTNLTSNQNVTDFSVFPVTIFSNYVIVTIQCNSSQPIYINTIHFSWLVFNKQYFNKANFASFTSVYLQNSSVTYTNTSQLYSQTTIVSVYSLHFQKEYSINYSITFNNPDSINLSSPNTNPYFQAMVLQFFTYYCHYSTPYLESSSNTCYDVCPSGTLADQATLTCVSTSQSNTTKIIIISCVVGVFLITIIILITYCLKKNNQEIREELSGVIYLEPPPRRQQVVGLSLIIEPAVNEPQISVETLNPENTLYNPQRTSKLIQEKPSKPNNPYLPSNVPSNPPAEDPIEKEDEKGEWKQRLIEESAKQACSVCLFDQTYFKTTCNHYFHIQCIIQWSRKSDVCPNCRAEGIINQTHKVFCRRCRVSEKDMSFRRFRAKHEANKLQEETICQNCKMIPL